MTRTRFHGRTAPAALLAIACIQLAFGQPGGSTRADIIDSVLERKAFSVTVPASWKFEGAMYPGTSCAGSPTPVYRISSPDGLSGAYLLPRIDWMWSGNSKRPAQPASDCMPLQGVASAKTILSYMVKVLNVGFVQEEQTPEAAAYQKSLQAMNAQTGGAMVFKGDMARFLVRYDLNGHPLEEYLFALVQCSDTVIPGPNIHQFQCSAWVRRSWMPLGKLQASAEMFRSIVNSEAFDPQWNQQWNALVARQINALYGKQTEVLLAMGRRAQSQRQQQQREFMAVMREGEDLRNNRFQEGQYVKQKLSDDRVDFLLDCQRYPNGVSVGNCPVRQTPAR